MTGRAPTKLGVGWSVLVIPWLGLAFTLLHYEAVAAGTWLEPLESTCVHLDVVLWFACCGTMAYTLVAT
jgi:hypothetical protein